MSAGSPAASNGTGTAPSQSEPRPTCSGADDANRMDDRTRDRRRVAAAGRGVPEPDANETADRRDPPQLIVGQVPPVVGRPPGRRCATRPPGGCAIPTTSSIVATDACAMSTISPRASISRTSSRPRSVRPPFVQPVGRAAVRRVEEVGGRDHAEAGVDERVERRQVRTERVAPSIASRPARQPRVAAPARRRYAARSSRGADEAGTRPRSARRAGAPDPRGTAPARAGFATCGAASARRRRALVTSSLRSSLRSMFRWRGDLTAAEAPGARRRPRSSAARRRGHGPAHEQVAAEQQRVRRGGRPPHRRVKTRAARSDGVRRRA